MEEEEKGQEPNETPPGAEQTDDAGSESLTTRIAVMEKELSDARKENASWRKKLRAQEEAQKEAQEAKLAEDKKWEELAKLKEAELTGLKARVEAETLHGLRLEVAMRTGLPVKFADRLQGSSQEELEADAAEILALLPKSADTPKPPAPNIDSSSVPPAKASKSAATGLANEELKIAAAYGMTPEEYAKFKG